MLNLTIYFGKAVLFPSGVGFSPDWFSFLWLVISFVALYRFKLNMILWIGISALAGMAFRLVLS